MRNFTSMQRATHPCVCAVHSVPCACALLQVHNKRCRPHPDLATRRHPTSPSPSLSSRPLVGGCGSDGHSRRNPVLRPEADGQPAQPGACKGVANLQARVSTHRRLLRGSCWRSSLLTGLIGCAICACRLASTASNMYAWLMFCMCQPATTAAHVILQHPSMAHVLACVLFFSYPAVMLRCCHVPAAGWLWRASLPAVLPM